MAEKKTKKIKAEKKEAEEKAEHAPGWKLNVYDLEGNVAGEHDLPGAFKHELRPDVIRRAVTAIESNARQASRAPTVRFSA